MKCEKCKDEIQEGMIFGNLMVKSFAQAGKSFNDIVIEKGWRLPTVSEATELVNNKKFLEWSQFEDKEHDFYIQQPFEKNKGKWAAWLGCDGDCFDLYADGELGDADADAARGVFLVKEKRGKE